MADEKEKAIEKGQEAIKPAEGKKGEMPEQDLDKVAGGFYNIGAVQQS